MGLAVPDSARTTLIVTACLLLVLGAISNSRAQQPSRDARYPAHWWTPIDDPKKPEWEILPQEAGPGEVILSKRNELGLLSNFAPTPFVFHGKKYASLEGFWQMMKYPEGPNDPRSKFLGIEWKYTRDQVAQMVSFEANKAGALASENMTKMGITWVSFEGKRFEYKPAVPGEHSKLIVEATWEKVKQNPEVKKVLLSTGDLISNPITIKNQTHPQLGITTKSSCRFAASCSSKGNILKSKMSCVARNQNFI